MLNGLDLFSGIGGLTLALEPWVRPLAYCEIDEYAQAVLLNRMAEGRLPTAPIYDDVRTLKPKRFTNEPIDIIYGGFPCQDISVAGRGKGLEGERSGLFFEIMRLVSEVRPTFLFLENVPAITTRGLREVTAEITKRGYDCRWTTLSASEVGANHKRNRWWLLAYADSNGIRDESRGSGRQNGESQTEPINDSETMGDSDNSGGLQPQRSELEVRGRTSNASWWTVEPDVGRVANGIPFRVDRIKGLGNAVVPLQARTAFKELMGLT